MTIYATVAHVAHGRSKKDNATSMPLKAFGAYIRQLRKRKGLTQSGVVDGMQGISLRTIGRWENGTHEPYISELAPVVEWLGGSVLRALLLLSSPQATEADAEAMANRADDDLTEEELAFFTSLSPARRRLLRAFFEAEDDD